MSEFMTTEQVADMLGVSGKTVRRYWVENPDPTTPTPLRISRKPGGRYSWRRSEVERWLALQETVDGEERASGL